MSERDGLLDALVSNLQDASDSDILAQARELGEGDSDAANALRERFLERVRLAREAPGRSSPQDRTLDASGESELDEEEQAAARIGRYPLLRRIGAGGMGVVYAAYDELLDRRVAVKVLHVHVWDSDGRRRERLLREAQAMARVSHPNVVAVHEVGTAGDQLFVAMEFVEGQTLQEWLRSDARSWREIAAMFGQVADGLAAIHEAGLVHRDVKPANVLVGKDGRARVLDLGLAGVDATEDGRKAQPFSSSSANTIDGSLTRTGECLGTPAYMSREQILGLPLTPASDIFSLCVALYEALYETHPFIEDRGNLVNLQSRILDGAIHPAPASSSVPTWLHGLVLRGLASDPAQRPQSMTKLAEELRKDPSRTRRRWLGSLGLALVAGLGGVALTLVQVDGGAPTCDTARERIEAIWNPGEAQRLRAAMAESGHSYAGPLASRTVDSLDDYAQRWVAARDRACEDHAQGVHSAALLDARVACLDRRRQALAETVALLGSGDDAVVARAGLVTAHLPRIETCDDLGVLEGEPRPTEPALAKAVAELEARLVRAQARAVAGQGQESLALVREAVRDAESLSHPPTLARALLVEAEIALEMPGSDSDVDELLGRGLKLAIEAKRDRAAAEAMIRRLHVRALDGHTDAALDDIAIAEAMLNRAGGDLELRALLFNNAGTIRLAAGQRRAAEDDFERALELKRQALGDEHLEIAVGLANLSMLSDVPAERRALQEQMLDIYEDRLGPEHPRTLDARLLTALFTEEPARASAELAALCPLVAAADETRLTVDCERALGQLAYFRGDLEQAERSFAKLQSAAPPASSVLPLADAYAALSDVDGDHVPKQAYAELSATVARIDGESGREPWWTRLEQAERRAVLAALLRTWPELEADRALERRLVELERALAELESLRSDAQPIEYERLLAYTRVELALALLEAGTNAPRAQAMVDLARAFFQRWPQAYEARLAQLQQTQARMDDARRRLKGNEQ
ncbi:serine/threonine kinase family protein [Plesiocystis pacifica SIR-1]|uniref:Serine/threonine kinase family protein n=1 Tax=Plesiocystis pacifica SIR-1 TaxID=391625 RepID=A6G2N2_9BACT|nr:serine/threonine-protein kinase [Plesiocystis pacifica]EDM79969.1 serine/threonine kinase family protein [Plesiocystis pacifica SIR-1]